MVYYMSFEERLLKRDHTSKHMGLVRTPQDILEEFIHLKIKQTQKKNPSREHRGLKKKLGDV